MDSVLQNLDFRSYVDLMSALVIIFWVHKNLQTAQQKNTERILAVIEQQNELRIKMSEDFNTQRQTFQSIMLGFEKVLSENAKSLETNNHLLDQIVRHLDRTQ